MLNKKERTLELYKRSGAEIRLLKATFGKLIHDVSCVLYAKDVDKLFKILDEIKIIGSKAEDNMFRDFPEISSKYLDVFYGDLDDVPRNKVDEEIIQKARTVADELFKRKTN